MMISQLNLCRCNFVFLLLLFASFSACAASPPRIIIVVAPGLTATDIDTLDPQNRAFKPSASGWMLCRAARTADKTETLPAQFLTLGSGSRAAVSQSVLRGGILPLDTVQKVGQGGQINPTLLAEIQTANANLDHSVFIGALGDILHRVGKHTTLIGDLETLQFDLSPFLFLMDASGAVDFWNPATTQPTPTEPYGITDNLNALTALSDSVLTVMVFGALYRADRYASYCLPEVAARHRRVALDKLRSLLKTNLSRPNTRIVLLSPAPADSITERFDKITPIRIYGGDAGILTSASTRRIGLILNTDLLPSIATWLNLPIPKNTLGRPIIVSPAPPNFPSEAALYEQFVNAARKQNIFGGLPTIQLLLVASAVAVVYCKKFCIAHGLATGVIALPLLLFVMPIFAPQSVILSGILLAALIILLMWIGTRKPIAFSLCLLLVGGIVLNLLMGSPLLKQAWMSYSVMEGARFYGIGNEYMGAVIGAACVLIGLSKSESNRTFWAIMALFGAAVLVMGLPRFGAKVGAIPSAGAALGVMLVVRKTGGFRLKHLTALVGVLILGLVVLALWDMRHAAEGQSHFARAVSGSGGGTLVQIALRKLSMEGTLLLRSPWSLTLWASAISFVWLRSRLPSLSQNANVGCSGIIAGAVASLLVNDAGVLASALILLYGTAFLCFATIERPNYPMSH